MSSSRKREPVVHHEPETLEQSGPTIARLAPRLVLADRLCGPLLAPTEPATPRISTHEDISREFPWSPSETRSSSRYPAEHRSLAAVAPSDDRSAGSSFGERKVLQPEHVVDGGSSWPLLIPVTLSARLPVAGSRSSWGVQPRDARVASGTTLVQWAAALIGLIASLTELAKLPGEAMGTADSQSESTARTGRSDAPEIQANPKFSG